MAAPSGYKQGPVISKPAAGTLVKGQGVILDTSGKWATPAAGGIVDAVLLDDAANTDDQVPAWQVTSGGEPEVKLGGTVTQGARLVVDASGLFIIGTSGEKTQFKALAAGAANEFIRAHKVDIDTIA